MKLASILLCSCSVLLVVVECTPVRRSDDKQAEVSSAAFDEGNGLKPGTTYTVEMGGPGSGHDSGDFMPPPDQFKSISSAEFSKQFEKYFGMPLQEYLNSRQNSEPTAEATTSEPTAEATTSEPTAESTSSE